MPTAGTVKSTTDPNQPKMAKKDFVQVMTTLYFSDMTAPLGVGQQSLNLLESAK